MLNRCEFIGNIGKDITTRTTQDGSPIASFPLAVSKRWKDRQSGERRESTTWINCVIFNENLCKVAENYLRKGSKIFIAGEWATRSYEKDGQTIYTTELVLQRFNGELVMLDARNDNNQVSSAAQSSGNADFDDSIPF